MHRYLKRALLSVSMSVLLAACAAPRPLGVSEFDQGREFRVRPGQTLTIALPVKRADGHRWALAQERLDALMLDGEPGYMRELGPEAAPDTDGNEIWRFTAVRRGRDELRFEYRKGKDVEREARFSVEVR